MTQISRAGIALAKQIATAYVDNSQVQIILVGGSVSRGTADEYSDLEMGLFWAEKPSVEVRQTAIEKVGGELWSLNEASGNDKWGLNEIMIDGKRYTGTLMVSTKHLSVADAEACLSDVIDNYDTEIDKQGLVFAIQYGIPLHGATLLGQWQSLAANYPDELARRMVRENLWMGWWFIPEQYIGRNDLLVLYQHYLHVEQSLLMVLSGLNRIYYPNPHHKWMDWLIARMQIAPPNLSARMKSIFRVDAQSAWNELKALIDETLSLVDQHVPDVDKPVQGEQNPPHVTLAWAKKRWKPRPPYSLMKNIESGLT